MATLASAWLVIALWSVLGPALGIVLALRLIASTVQSVFNILLGRRWPLEGPGRVDWCLVALLFGGVYATAFAAGGDVQAMMRPDVLALLMAPFTVLQLRMAVRSYRADWVIQRRLVESTRSDPVLRYVPVARETPGLSRAA